MRRLMLSLLSAAFLSTSGCTQAERRLGYEALGLDQVEAVIQRPSGKVKPQYQDEASVDSISAKAAKRAGQ
jgi:hypothetical protein